jgi:hypothetical protein
VLYKEGLITKVSQNFNIVLSIFGVCLVLTLGLMTMKTILVPVLVLLSTHLGSTQQDHIATKTWTSGPVNPSKSLYFIIQNLIFKTLYNFSKCDFKLFYRKIYHSLQLPIKLLCSYVKLPIAYIAR